MNVSETLESFLRTSSFSTRIIFSSLQRPAEATDDLIGNKIAEITSVSKKKLAKELHNNDEDMEITTHKKRYISPEESQQIIDESTLVPKKYV